jgi:hypothetical protein
MNRRKKNDFAKDRFEFLNTKNGTRVVNTDTADFMAIKSYFDEKKLHYFSFHPKSEKNNKSRNTPPSKGHSYRRYLHRLG